MPTWEYLTTPLIIHNTAAILNNWGSEGWELVQVVPGPEGGLVAYLKRPVGGERPPRPRGPPRPPGRQAVRGRGLMAARGPPGRARHPAPGGRAARRRLRARRGRRATYVFTAGQLPFVDGALPGDRQGRRRPRARARRRRQGRTPARASSTRSPPCSAELGSLDRVTRIVKVVGFVASDPSFTGQPGVDQRRLRAARRDLRRRRRATRAPPSASRCCRSTRRSRSSSSSSSRSVASTQTTDAADPRAIAARRHPSFGLRDLLGDRASSPTCRRASWCRRSRGPPRHPAAGAA